MSYVYDSWGKITPSKAELDDTTDTNKDGITGTLKDTIGVKNPYRYRGYRYDSETELYYLQSRYYNPEWGRFINADVIAAVTGELLSANMFAYCKNSPTTLKDPSGFRPIYTAGEETVAMREASLATMSKTNMHNYQQQQRNNKVKNTAATVVHGVVGGGINATLEVIPEHVPLPANNYYSQIGKGFMIPVKGLSVVRGINAGIGIALTGYTVWDNFAHYQHPIERTAITGLGIVAGVFVISMIGVTSTPFIIAGVAASTVIGIASSLIADEWFGEKR